ncbi:Histidine--tRNA ligase [Quillaja saponaria]|uniref:Histidine--tRNA ligase, cytoplasmic n=1 Tax=Quillaja saponaria TaxID=32244 RepID=A0AAD7KNE5_QUISA|nr:Histidine--tRNA ligase [Quillaja saponaria]
MAESERGEVNVVTLGGKGSSLSSSSLYAIASGIAKVRIDTAALDRLSRLSSKQPSPSVVYKIFFPEVLTVEERRAFIVVLLNKLLLSNSSGIRTIIAEHICEALNSKSQTLECKEFDVTKDELVVLNNSTYTLLGICGILDHLSAALSVFADAAAAVSCEASRSDVTVFNLMDTGDGHVAKEEVGVASDMKVLLNGSKLVGKVDSDSTCKILKIHGSLREQVKLVHSKSRVELNTGLSGSSETEYAVQTVLLSLAATLWKLGKISLFRVKNILDSMDGNNLKSSLEGVFERICPSGPTLNNVYKTVSELFCEEDYDKFAHEVNVLLGIVWKIVAWEAITAFVALEGVDWNERGQGVEANGENVKVEKKNEKKKKKVVLGKGTGAIVQLIKDRLNNGCNDVENSGLLEKRVGDLLSFFDSNDPEFEGFLLKVKAFVESNESRRLPKLPKGTRDFAKEQMAIREKAFSLITGVFKRHGATALDTPAFELRETLMGKYGEDSKLVYDLADQGGELCSLRYDLTVPFARYVAMNGITSFKRYQIAKVYRRDNPSKGRYREFYQCDFDIAGQYEKMGPDFEVVYIMTELLDELDIGDYEIKLNHRKLLDGMLEICGVPPEKFRTICSSIDKLDKQSFDQIKKEMVEEKGLSAETAERIGTFVKERGSPLELLYKFKQEGSKFLESNGSVEALNELEVLFKALDKSKCIGKVVFDLSLARGLDYYTGVIFEAVFKGGIQVGTIAAGGRYDNLIGMFGTKQVPAVGVSLGIERVFAIMEQLQKGQSQTARATETEVLVSILGDDATQAAELVSELWRAKVKAEFSVNKRVMKHIDRAKESRIPWMVIVGEREASEGIVKLKDVEATKDVVIPRSKIVEELQLRLNP